MNLRRAGGKKHLSRREQHHSTGIGFVAGVWRIRNANQSRPIEFVEVSRCEIVEGDAIYRADDEENTSIWQQAARRVLGTAGLSTGIVGDVRSSRPRARGCR